MVCLASLLPLLVGEWGGGGCSFQSRRCVFCSYRVMCVGLWPSNIRTSCTSICAAWRKCWFLFSRLELLFVPSVPPHLLFFPPWKQGHLHLLTRGYFKITEYWQWLHPWDCFRLPIPGLQGAIWEDAGIDWPWKGATGPWWAALDHELADVGAACQRPVPEQLTPRSMVFTSADLCVKLSRWCPPIADHALVLFCHSDGRPLFVAIGLWIFFPFFTFFFAIQVNYLVDLLCLCCDEWCFPSK